jgi:hypothetical protein
VWIGGESFGPHGAAFIPPHHVHVPALMADLVTFTQRADLPLLSQAAIVEKLASASFAATASGRQLLGDRRAIRHDWDDKIKARRGATVWQLADILLRRPVIDTPTVAREIGVTPQNALRAVTPLVDANILEEFTGFARNRVWQTRQVLDALDDFAARAGRRG